MDDLKLYAKTEEELESLVQTVRVFSEDIGIKFSIEKCSMLVMKRGKKVNSDRIKLPDDTVMKEYKYREYYKLTLYRKKKRKSKSTMNKDEECGRLLRQN